MHFYNAEQLFSDVIGTVNFCLQRLGSRILIPDWQMWQIDQFRKNRVRWEAHLPDLLLSNKNDPADYLKRISNKRTIVVVGDIRKSQDLMTYAEQPTDYSENIGRFMTKTRDLVFEFRGIFDKFTGDGFVAYFNEAMCARLNREFVGCFFNFVQDIQKYADVFFPEWIRTIRKYPSTPIGLSIGADIGQVQFDDKDQHFVAFGDSIVWATRMCAEGHAGELIVNNLLYHKLKGIDSLKFTERSAQTKSGENFLARLVEERRSYPRPKRLRQ